LFVCHDVLLLVLFYSQYPSIPILYWTTADTPWLATNLEVMAKYSVGFTTIGATNGNVNVGVCTPDVDPLAIDRTPKGTNLGAFVLADSAVANDSEVCP
jgi:hypothetical protein